jgi:hypothetical protein
LLTLRELEEEEQPQKGARKPDLLYLEETK